MKLFHFVLILVPLLHVAPAHSQQPLVLSTGTLDPYTSERGDGFLNLLVAQVFGRFGLTARVAVYAGASARSMALANKGEDDGLAMRIKGLEKRFPNLIRVSEPVIDNDFVAYSTRHDFATPGWDSLKPYILGHIIGWRIFERNLGVQGGANITRVKNARQLFRLLKRDRVEIVLYERWQGLWRARKEKLKVHLHEPPLARREMFMYLHKNHRTLVPKAARVLAEMKRDGAYRKIIDSTLTPLLASR